MAAKTARDVKSADHRSGKIALTIVGKDRNIVESLIFSRARVKGNIYVSRFLMRMAELAQNVARDSLEAYVEGRTVSMNMYNYPEVVLFTKDLFSGEDAHYSRAIEAVRGLLSCTIEIEDENFYRAYNLIVDGEVDKTVEQGRRPGVIQLTVNPKIWSKFVDFSKGYSLYNISVACSLKNELSVRIYKGLMNQKGPVTYSVENFREVFDLKDKFLRTTDLVHKAIDRARGELYEKADYAFDYELVYGRASGDGRGRRTVSSIVIIPKRVLRNASDDSVRKMVHPGQIVGKEAWRILTEKLYFNFGEVKAHVKLFECAVRNLGEAGFAGWLDSIVPSAVRADSSTQGYVVNSLKRYLRKRCGVVFSVGEDSSPALPVEAEPMPEAAGDGRTGVSVAFKEKVTDILTKDARPSAKERDGHGFSLGDLFSSLEED